MEFITMTTGHVSVTQPSDVDPEVIRMIQNGLRHKAGALWEGWSVALIRSDARGYVFDMVLDGTVLSRCWVCIDAAASDAMWRACIRAAAIRRDMRHPQAVPWLAVALLPGSFGIGLTQPDRLFELGDAERCVAWALLTRTSEEKR